MALFAVEALALLALLAHGRLDAQGGTAAEAERLWDAGDRPAAVELLASVLDATPEDATVRRRVFEWELAIHRYAAALEHAERLGPEVDPERGYCLHALGRFEEALRYLDPARKEHALLIFDTLESLGRRADAKAALERAARLLGDGDPGVLVRRGRLALEDGELSAAEAAFRRALERDSLLAEAWFGLGRALLLQQKREEAAAALERHRELVPLLDAHDFALRSLDLAPRHAPNHAALGDAERALGRLERAEECYRTASALAAADELAPIALRHARLLEEDRHDVDGALLVLRSAFARAGDPRLLVRAGDLLLAAGRGAEALAEFTRAAELRPADAEIRRRVEAAKSATATGGER